MSIWASGDLYEPYVGRWSRLVAADFLRWLGAPAEKRWLDVGCGTGALSRAIVEAAAPADVTGIDPSDAYVAYASRNVPAPQAHFEVGDAQSLPFPSQSFDCAVSGLVLNFLADPAAGVAEMARVTRPGGTVAAYLWAYADKMELMRYFWDAATALDGGAGELDEGRRFPICNPQSLQELFAGAGLEQVSTRSIDVPTNFRDFDDYWQPFLGGQGPAPGYAMSLSEASRAALRDRIRAALPIENDGSIRLIARAWGVRGLVPAA